MSEGSPLCPGCHKAVSEGLNECPHCDTVLEPLEAEGSRSSWLGGLAPGRASPATAKVIGYLITFGIIVGLAFFGDWFLCGRHRIEPEFVIKADNPDQRETVEDATEFFLDTCTDLAENWEDVESAEARWAWLSIEFGDGYGWGQVVEFQIKIKDEPSSFAVDKARAAGHTLHYTMGAGKMPGLFCMKSQSCMMCGTDGTKEREWISIPYVGSLDLSSQLNPAWQL